MSDILSAVGHRPWPLPEEKWVMTQRWNDLLFAHWPIPVSQVASLIPDGLELDTFDGSAWIGIVPFWMDRIRVRGLPPIPGASRFPELNLRTYVRQRNTNVGGVYFFSLDATSLLAVTMARLAFHLPYYWSRMQIHARGNSEFSYQSERNFARKPARFRANYRGLGPSDELAQSRPGTIEHFLTERYCLYTVDRSGHLMRGNIHHQLWPLEIAEAEFILNDLPAAHGIKLPDTKPLLYYSRELAVYIWSLELALSVGQAPAVPALSGAETV
jgi:hypothetical protein